MSRCGCDSFGCACAVQGSSTDCIDVNASGTGAGENPYIIGANPIINPDACNTLECTPTGLLNKVFIISGDDCIVVSGCGTEADPYVISLVDCEPVTG